MSARIHSIVESIISSCSDCDHQADTHPTCGQNALRKHYGTNIFKCIFPTCSFNRQGFVSGRGRENHIKHHSRPWKCPQPTCQFATIGFDSRRACDQHWMSKHREESGKLPQFEGIETEDLQALLFEITKRGDICQLQQLLKTPGIQKLRDCGYEISLIAARLGSFPMVELISSAFKYVDFQDDFVVAAIRSQDPDLFRWILSHVRDGECSTKLFYTPFVKEALKAADDEIYAIFEDYLFKPEFDVDRKYKISKRNRLRELMQEGEKTAILFSEPAFRAVHGQPLREIRLIQTWRKFSDRGHLSSSILGVSLTQLARSTCSVVLGKELLRLGADVNFPSSHRGAERHTGRTALHTAALKSNAEAAQFMAFLLTKGADPSISWGSRTPAMELGAMGISKWLGKTWEELLGHGSMVDPNSMTSRRNKRRRSTKRSANDRRSQKKRLRFLERDLRRQFEAQ